MYNFTRIICCSKNSLTQSRYKLAQTCGLDQVSDNKSPRYKENLYSAPLIIPSMLIYIPQRGAIAKKLQRCLVENFTYRMIPHLFFNSNYFGLMFIVIVLWIHIYNYAMQLLYQRSFLHWHLINRASSLYSYHWSYVERGQPGIAPAHPWMLYSNTIWTTSVSNLG